MRLHPFSVGPILGAVTEQSIRLWGRGLDRIKTTYATSCLGVARLQAKGQKWGETVAFPLDPNRDYTGWVEFSGLMPNTSYRYQTGWLPGSTLPDNLDWSGAHTATVTTASTDPTAPRTFVFGSCRYLLRINAGVFFEQVGDRTFQQILNLPQPIHRFLMLGDQIYADDLGRNSPDQTLEEYNLRYRLAFSQPHLRQVMATIPTAGMLDDHEIINNWPRHHLSGQVLSTDEPYYQNAIQSFQNYQLSPILDPKSQPNQNWYQFQDGCCDFFIADTRTERTCEKIISDRQMTAIKNWLSDGNGRVKILASSVLIFPDASKPNNDQCSGFPDQQMKLLDYIRIKKIRRIIFISGDVHASLIAKLTHPDDPSFQIISIVSSPFFWPVLHGKAKKFQLQGTLGDSLYQVHGATPVMNHDNFTRVQVTPESVNIQIIPRQERLLFWRQKNTIETQYSLLTS